MEPALLLHPNAAGLTLAAGAVVAGAPVFSEGLRALRLRRHLGRLRETPIAEAGAGFAWLSGRVALESPMFAPLSAAPCAGFALEVHAVGGPVSRTLEVHRPFRVSSGGASVRVTGTGGRWELSATAEREVGPEQALSENLGALLEQAQDALWWRRAGGTLRLVERALKADAECHVVGIARQARPLEVPADLEVLRTGTGDEVVSASAAHLRAEPDLWVGPGEHLDFLLVCDRAPRPEQLTVSGLRALGVLAGPALSLFGLLYLASAADYLRSLGRF
ncbi:MAG: hypothetical protein HZC42_01760 [Candidatus Eisenbacteria bacterium]|nr:hypothetical protein [Candidatus Eisenbacteria bacterium]